MAGRALLGIAIDGFGLLSTATVVRLVSPKEVPKALGLVYMGNAVATAFAAPIGAYVGGLFGWRFVFAALVPLALLTLFWQMRSLPSIPSRGVMPMGRVFKVLVRRPVAFGMLAVMLTYGGTIAAFTYFRPFFEHTTGVGSEQFSQLLLALGVAGFAGTRGAARVLARGHVLTLLMVLPLGLAALTLALVGLGQSFWMAAILLVAWGVLNSAIPVAWSTWLAKEISDEPESGGLLIVASIQSAILLRGALGGAALDRFGAAAPLLGGAAVTVLAALVVGSGTRLTGSTSSGTTPR